VVNTTRKRIKVEVTELEAQKITHVSLVKHAANRTPFRTFKSDTTNSPQESTLMTHLSDMLFTGKKKEKAIVVGVMVRKDAYPQLRDQLIKAGIDTTNIVEENEHTLVLKQADYTEDEVQGYKASDDIIVLLTGVKKSFDPFPDSTNFTENIQAAGFFPSFRMATDTLFDTIHSIMFESRGPSEAKTMLNSAIESYKLYTGGLIENLPTVAFKMEGMIMSQANEESMSKNDEDSIPAKTKALSEPESKAVEKESFDILVKSDDESPKEPAQVDTAAESTPEVPGDHEEEGVVSKKDEDIIVKEDNAEAPKEDTETPNLAELLLSMKSEVMESIKVLSTDVKGLSARVDEVEQVAKSAKDATISTVLSASDNSLDESLIANDRVQKGSKDDEQWNGVLDNILS